MPRNMLLAMDPVFSGFANDSIVPLIISQPVRGAKP